MQTILGLLAGIALWSAWGELGQAAGVGRPASPEDWPVMLIVWLFIVLGVGAPFPPVSGIRALVGLPVDLPVAGATWGVITAGEFYLLTWLGHVTLLIAFYHPRFGVWNWLTWLLLVGSLVGSAVLLPQMVHQVSLAEGIRWAIWAAIVLWTAIEILKKWGLLSRLLGRRKRG